MNRLAGMIVAALLLSACGAAPTPGTEVPTFPPSLALTDTLAPTRRPTLDDSTATLAPETDATDLWWTPSPTATLTLTPTATLALTPIPTLPMYYPFSSSLPEGAVEVLGASLDVQNAEVSPDGQYKVAIAPYGVAVYDAGDNLLWAMQAAGAVARRTISFEYGYIALEIHRGDEIYSFEDLVGVWDIRTGEYVTTLYEGEKSIRRMERASDGQTLFISTWTAGILWHLPTNTVSNLTSSYAEGDQVYAYTWSPDASLFAVAARVNETDLLRLYDLTADRETPIATMQLEDKVYTLAFHPSGELLYCKVVHDWDHNTLMAWNRRGELAFKIDPFDVGNSQDNFDFNLSPTGQFITSFQTISLSDDAEYLNVAVRNALTGEMVQEWQSEVGRMLLIRSFEWSHDDAMFMLAFRFEPVNGRHEDGTGNVMVLSLGSEEPLWQATFEKKDVDYFATYVVAQWSEDERTIIIDFPHAIGAGVLPPYFDTEQVRDALTGTLLSEQVVEDVPSPYDSRQIMDVALSPDGQLLAYSSWTHLRIYDLALGQLTAEVRFLPTLGQWGAGFQRMSFSPDGDSIVIGGYGVNVYDIEANRLSILIEYGGNYVYDLAWLPNRNEIVIATREYIQVYSFETGKPLSDELPGGMSIGLSPDQQYLATRGVVYDLESWQPIRALAHLNEYTNDFAFSPDGAYLAVAEGSYFNGPVEVYELATGQVIRQMVTDRYAANHVEWSAEGGSLFVSYGLSPYGYNGGYNPGSGSIGTVLIWDPVSGELLRHLSGQANDVQGLALDLERGILYTGAINGTVILWDVSDLP